MPAGRPFRHRHRTVQAFAADVAIEVASKAANAVNVSRFIEWVRGVHSSRGKFKEVTRQFWLGRVRLEGLGELETHWRRGRLAGVREFPLVGSNLDSCPPSNVQSYATPSSRHFPDPPFGVGSTVARGRSEHLSLWPDSRSPRSCRRTGHCIPRCTKPGRAPAPAGPDLG